MTKYYMMPGAGRPDILIDVVGDLELYPKNEKPLGISNQDTILLLKLSKLHKSAQKCSCSMTKYHMMPGAGRPDIFIVVVGDLELYPKNEKPLGISNQDTILACKV